MTRTLCFNILLSICIGCFSVTVVLEQVCSQPPPPVGFQLLGIDRLGVLYDINPLTGDATNPRPTGFGSLGDDIPIGLACSKDGTLYTVIQGSPLNRGDALYKLDLVTGSPTLIGSLISDIRRPILEGDLAFNPVNERLYGIANNGFVFIVDLQTGRRLDLTQISAGQTPDFSAMGFDNNGQLYALSTFNELSTQTNRLFILNPNSGATIGAVNTRPPLGTGAGMAIDPQTGQFFVASGNAFSPFFVPGTTQLALFTLDTRTGDLTRVGPLLGASDGLVGLTFCPITP